MAEVDQDEIGEKLADIQRENALLEMENNLLTQYTNRVLQASAEEGDDGDKRGGKANRKGAKKDRVPVELTMPQKFDIAMTEAEQAKGAVEETKQVSEKLIDDLRALLEEADIKIAEISKDQYEFKRDVNAGAPGKPLADKVVHFLEDKLRTKDSVCDKLTLKNAALKQQILKLENQLQHKEEMGEVLHRLMVESETLKRMIVEKQALAKRVQEEIEGIDIEKLKVKKANSALHKQIEESGMPEVLEYVKQKAMANQLRKELGNYERKVEIGEMELRRTKTKTRGTEQ
ncbi:hypothetical protein T484DRAFT_1944153 [Baffinella frigidus]|nr:hypothetical protein T484DRAFT_1944153 [Cryptophyta sp. CCMP2293]